MATPRKQKTGETTGNRNSGGTRAKAKRAPAKKTTASRTTKTTAKSKTPAAKKAKTSARKTSTKKTATKPVKNASIPTQDEIRERARELWLADGGRQGDAFQNWIDAERQLYSARGF